ncbi:FkbM family methyltransferase [Acidisphaera sp. S103]|uniref:FkbM family methyltransferase n=1 Tax=Acidisphaera sp. S103 TaxID=1747223 RepID=UPI00131D17D6|nr:FkbM family methyltransferase [Acidisphaera sp. S103]
MPDNYYRFKPSVGWFVHVWKALTRQDHGHWRPFIARYLPRDGIAIDVGAHGGQFTRLLAGMAPDGLVIAVEPSGYARSILRVALWLRGTRNVLVVAAGLGDQVAMAMIRTPIKRRGDLGYGLATFSALARPSIVEPVAILTLDEMARSIDFPALHLIKADIEGFEAALIAGGTDTIEKHKPAILLEMNAFFLLRAGASLDGLWERMTGLGYAPYRLLEGNGGFVPCPGEPVEGDIVWLPNSVANSA